MTEAAQMLHICPSPCILFWKPDTDFWFSSHRGCTVIAWGLQHMGFFPHFLMPPREWISELTWVKTPGKTETRLFYTWINSFIQFTVLLHKRHSWGCGVRGNGLVWGSREAGNLSDSAVIKAHVSWYSACHEAADKIWNPSCCKNTPFFFSGGVLKWVTAMKGTGETLHAPVVLQSLELPLWAATEGIAQLCLNI